MHGAGGGPWIFDGWAAAFPDLDVDAVDLQAGLVVARASMRNYAAAVAARANLLPPPVAVCAWSMGGLAALLAGERAQAARLVLLEPSPPAEVQGVDDEVALEEGTFDPEAVYGRFPPGIAARAESSLARGERKRGMSVPALPCPALVVYGEKFPAERGRHVASFYGAEELELAGVGHWGLVLEPAARERVRRWLR